jgi:type I restriction enzyme S subunit
LLKSEEIRGKIRNLSGQAVNQVSVNTSDLYNLKLPLPPLPEQQKIAEILKTIDNAIEKTDKIIEKYKRIKQGLMQDLLTKGIDENGNIRDEKTHKFKDSPLGRIPEEWEVIRLGEVGEVVNGFSFPIKYQGREFGNLPFIKVNDLNKSPKYIISSDNYIDQITTEFLKVKIFPPDTIVFPKIGMAVYQNKYRILKTFATFDNNIAGVLPKNYSSNFLFYYFSVKLDLKGLAGETAVPSIKKSILEAILLPLPLLPEQQRIAEILSQTDQTIEKEQQYKEKLQRIKQGLMEDLLTGKLRVNNLIKED